MRNLAALSGHEGQYVGRSFCFDQSNWNVRATFETTRKAWREILQVKYQRIIDLNCSLPPAQRIVGEDVINTSTQGDNCMLWKKEKKVHRLMEDYMDEALVCVNLFQDCLFALFEDSTSEKAEKLVQKVDAAESRADELRNKIEFKLYRKVLMPESRGDILGLVEAVDRIPNWAEEVVYDIYLQRVQFPKTLIKKFRRITEMNVECVHLLHKAVGALFTDIDAVFDLTKKVDQKESEIDTLEHQLIRDVFDIEERLSYQNLLHRIVRQICDISDKTENAGDRLTIIAIKKMV